NMDDVEEETLRRVHRVCTELREAADHVHAQAIIHSTHAEIKKRINVWGPAREDFALMKRIKQVFDPHGILSPGRFVGGL
ncbi:MAG: FAD-linked oxidase C-terminal domain-containing protein, partial [Candidatus Acidiferrales bacterium]